MWICPFKHNTWELNICACSEAQVCVLLLSARTNLLTAQVSSCPLGLKCLNWQSLHEFSLKTDINVCGSGLTCACALSAPGWWRIKCSYSSIHSHWTRLNGLSTLKKKMYRCCCNVLGSQNAHPSTETYISRFFFLRVIYNKPYCRCIVRFKLNCSPSVCQTVWTVHLHFFFFLRPVPPLVNDEVLAAAGTTQQQV